MPKKHHSSKQHLREQLMKAGRAMLEKEGYEALSIRKLATTLDVSHNAPYMHFSNKEALVSAIAAEGFVDLQKQISKSVSKCAGDWLARFKNGCLAYIKFAVANPALYETMNRSYDPENQSDAFHAGISAFEGFKSAVKEGQTQNILRPNQTEEITLTLWSTIHGLATIVITRNKTPAVFEGKEIDEVAQRIITLVLEGVLCKQEQH